jgi:EF hand
MRSRTPAGAATRGPPWCAILRPSAALKRALFDRLDRDRDGTLDWRELRGRVDANEFAAADPDKDGTLTKDEYFTIVEKRAAARA